MRGCSRPQERLLSAPPISRVYSFFVCPPEATQPVSTRPEGGGSSRIPAGTHKVGPLLSFLLLYGRVLPPTRAQAEVRPFFCSSCSQQSAAAPGFRSLWPLPAV